MKQLKYGISAVLVGISAIAPLSAGAVEITVGEQSGIYEYLDTYGESLSGIDFQLDQDEDGNRSARLKIYGLQKIALEEQSRIYDLMDFEVAPSYISMSGSAGIGLYRSALDNQIHSVTVTPFSGSGSSGSASWASSDEFTVFFTWSNRYGVNLTWDNYINGRYCGGRLVSWQSGSSFGVSQSGSYFTGMYTNNDPYSSTFSVGIDSGNIEILSRSFNWHSVLQSNPQYIGWAGDVVDIPPADDVPTDNPWNYYNDDLLPYIWEEFGHEFDDILVFPDGYTPPVPDPTVPVEYPTAPVFDFGLAENGTQPAGMETAAFELPEIETKSVGVPVFDLSELNPAEIVAPVSNGLRGIWALITDVLESFGLFPLVMLSLLVSVIGALLLLGR